MRWFRSRSRLGLSLALLALTVQLAVSFVHVHRGRAAPGVSQPAPLFDVRTPLRKSGAALLASDEAPPFIDEYCAACALIQHASTAIASGPAALRLPVAFDLLRAMVPVELSTAVRVHSPLQARAPPPG
jgi:hypothetical protein